MVDENVKAILENETESFRLQTRQSYVDSMAELNIPPKVDDAAIVVGSSLAKTYVQVSFNALRDYDAVLITGKGRSLGKAIAIVEQVKQKYDGELVQLNQANLHSSLVNPAYKPDSSSKNIQVFLNDDESTQGLNIDSSEKSAADVLREIRGHKVYQVPSIRILLVKANRFAEGKLLSWSKQSKD